jgi:hypothetical protein
MNAFTGNPAPLTGADYQRAAKAIGCTVAAIQAVADIESCGGFLADNRPKILFECHVFSRLTGHKFDAAHPGISSRTPGGYSGGAAEYTRLAQALVLDRPAALQSASWGAFQLMGFNHAAAGFANVEAFVAAMVSGQPAQLDAFVAFIKTKGLADTLIHQNWPAFARSYNGPDYAKNSYDKRLASAYARHDNGGAHTDNPRPYCAWATAMSLGAKR